MTYCEKMKYSEKTKAKCMTEYVGKNFLLLICSLQKQPPGLFCKKGVLRNLAKFTGKHLCQRPFFNKVAGQVCDFIKKSL